MLDADFTFKMRRYSFSMSVDLMFDALAIRNMDSVQPLFGTIADFIFLIPEHRLPARREIDEVFLQVPIPKSIVRALGRQGKALLAQP